MPWWFGLVLSALFALLRYRIAAVPQLLASAGIGACAVLAAVGLIHVSPVTGASLVINGAFIGFIIDALHSRRFVRKEHASPLESASVTLDFRPGHDPKRVAGENIHAAYSIAMYLMSLSPTGPQKHMTEWIVSVWFAGPILDYIPQVEVISGEATKATILYQCDIGLVAAVEMPKGGVVRIKAQKDSGT